MFTANYPSLMLGVNKPGTVVTLTLPILAAPCTGQDLNLCVLLLPSRRSLSGVSSLGYSQAGFAPKSPGIAEQCVPGEPSLPGTLGGPHSWPLLQSSHGYLEKISVSQNPTKLLRGLAATDFKSLNKKQGLARVGSSLDLTPALLMFPNPAASMAVDHFCQPISGDRWQDKPLLTSQPTCLIMLSPPKS